jgi:ATP-dependent RNA circularization protein (DNA/RNA ligase family)
MANQNLLHKIGIELAIPVTIFEYGTDNVIKSCNSIKEAAQFLFRNPQKAKRITSHMNKLNKKLRVKEKSIVDGKEVLTVRFVYVRKQNPKD